MTIQEFHQAFDLELDKTLDFELPYMLPEQKDYWLNKAQDRFVKSRAFGNNLFKTAFEQTEKRVDDLRTIVTDSPPISTSLTGTTYSSTLPNDYLYLIRHQCHTQIPGNNTILLVAGIQATHDEMNILKKDPFWEPIAFDPLYYIMGSKIVYETDGSFIVQDSILTYIRTYAKIQYGSQYITPTTDVTSELPVHTHQEIVDIATSMVLENIESNRYQTNLNELTKTE